MDQTQLGQIDWLPESRCLAAEHDVSERDGLMSRINQLEGEMQSRMTTIEKVVANLAKDVAAGFKETLAAIKDEPGSPRT